MKKISVIFLCVAMLITMLSVSVSAAASTGATFNIPKAAKAPVIDGKIDGDEWDNALVRTLTAADVDDPTNSGLEFQGATFRWMWDDAGTYVFIEANDTTASDIVPGGDSGSYNSGDGAQLCVYTSADIDGNAHGTLFFFSLMPAADDGNTYIGEHFVYGTDSAGANVTEAKIAAVITDAGYVIECFIQKEAWAMSDPAIEIKSGAVLPLANIIMDAEGSTQALFTDTAWFSGINSNLYTLTDDVAGHVEAPVVEAAPVVEESAPAAAESVAETAPAVEAAPVVVAAQTGDAIIAVAALIVACGAAVAISKKRA